MSGPSANTIDRLRGPHDGILELIIVQPSDWESDPFIVKTLRDKVSRYQAFLVGDEFHRTYSGCRGVIVLETPHFPPEEVQQILAKEGVEVRVAQVVELPDGVDQVRETSNGTVEFIIQQQRDWESDPLLMNKLRETSKAIEAFIESDGFAQSYPGQQGAVVLETMFAPPADIRGMLKKLFDDIRAADAAVEAAAAPVAAPPAPAPTPAAAPAPAAAPPVAAEEPPKPRFVQRKPPIEDDWESSLDDDPYDAEPLSAATGGSKPPLFFVGIGLSVLFACGVLYGLFGGSSAAPVGAPKAIAPTSVSSTTLPKQSYASITARPDRGTFVMIPIKSAKSGKEEFYFLFSTKEQRKLLIFASQNDSKIVSKINFVKHPMEDDEKIAKPVWKSDLKGGGDKAVARTYVGRLEAAQRRKHGPVEVVLPDNNRNVNEVYKRLGIKFPADTMVLVVGEKPKPPSGNNGIILMVCFIGLLVSGGVAFAANNSAKRNF